jgi:hypothetical protein
LKTKNLKVIEDLVAILNIDEVSFGWFTSIKK